MKKLICLIFVILLCLPFVSCAFEEEPTYTVTFYNNKGIIFDYYPVTGDDYEERIVIKSQDKTVYKTETVINGYPSEPEPPTNGDYVFLGWYQNPECTEEFLFGHYEIHSNINLYAKWGRN